METTFFGIIYLVVFALTSNTLDVYGKDSTNSCIPQDKSYCSGRLTFPSDITYTPLYSVSYGTHNTQIKLADNERIWGLGSFQSNLDLQGRIATADLVVVGNVTETSLVQHGKHLPVREHDALWSQAVVRVEDVKKGSLSHKELIVIFPASYDVAWFKVPKLHKNQEAILILHLQNIPRLNINGYTAINQSDVLPVSELARINMLLNPL